MIPIYKDIDILLKFNFNYYINYDYSNFKHEKKSDFL